MDIQGIGLFRMISQQLRWLGQRQDVLSQNVANADTPGYQARDLQPLAFGDALQQATLRPAVTQAGHIDGNGVVLEQQMTSLAETQADYQMATEIYRKQIGMLKTAIGSNKG